MSDFDRADADIQSLQVVLKDYPRLFQALKQLSYEIRRIFINSTLGPTITDPEYIFKLVGLKRDGRFNTVELVDRYDRLNIGSRPGSGANGKVQIEEITNDHTSTEIITLKRQRPDTVTPLAGFGGFISFRLQGFTVDSEPIAGKIETVWQNNQNNDTTNRDSEVYIYSMQNNFLLKRIYINGGGSVIVGDGSTLSTTSINGFLHIPSMPGTPTGVPSLLGDAIPLVIDRTNFLLYGYIAGAWRNLSGGGGGGASYTLASVTIPYGSISATSSTIVDAAVTATSKIAVEWQAIAETDENSPEMDDIVFHVVDRAAGQFAVRVTSHGAPIGGTFNIMYLIG